MEYPLLAALAAALALVVTPVVRALAIRVGAVGALGSHQDPERRVPRLGGLAVLAAALGTLVADALAGGGATRTFSARGARPAWLLAGVALLTATGVVDDLRGLRVRRKLLLQIGAAGLALVGGYALEGVTDPFTGRWLAFGALGGAVTFVWIVGVTNAFNLIDGLDGLAAGVGAIGCTTLFLIALVESRPDAAGVWLTFAGALVGFLAYNFAPASIFLGDTGSMLLGYAIAVLAIQSLQKGATAVVVLAPILALGLPITDTLLAVGRRTRAAGLLGIVQADREHIHHRLLGVGLSQRTAVLVLYAACAGFGALAFVAVVSQGLGDAVVVALAAVAIAAGARRLRRGRVA